MFPLWSPILDAPPGAPSGRRRAPAPWRVTRDPRPGPAQRAALAARQSPANSSTAERTAARTLARFSAATVPTSCEPFGRLALHLARRHRKHACEQPQYSRSDETADDDASRLRLPCRWWCPMPRPVSATTRRVSLRRTCLAAPGRHFEESRTWWPVVARGCGAADSPGAAMSRCRIAIEGSEAPATTPATRSSAEADGGFPVREGPRGPEGRG